MRAYKFVGALLLFRFQYSPSRGVLLTDIILPFEETQSLSKAEPRLAGCRACPIRVSGLSHRLTHDCFQYQGIRCLLPTPAFNLRNETGAAHVCLALLHRERASTGELARTLQAASGR